MKFVQIQDPVEFVSIEIRIPTPAPEDPDTFLVLKSMNVKDEGKAFDRASWELRQLREHGFNASAWKVSRAQVNEMLNI